MHGWALNVNTDLRYFDNIIPCGIRDKQVTSLERETGNAVNIEVVKDLLVKEFEQVFDVEVLPDVQTPG